MKLIKYLASKAFLKALARITAYGASLIVAFTLPQLVGIDGFWSGIGGFFGLVETRLIMVSSETYGYIEKVSSFVFGSAFFEGALLAINQIGGTDKC